MAGRAELEVDCGGTRVRALVDRPADADRGALYVMAHGAGGHMADKGMSALAGLYAAIGLTVVRFNFPYREIGSRRPDPMPRLTACVAAVAQRAQHELGGMRAILGGRSMGGRAASVLAAEGFACEALLLLAYPLHPAGQPERLRDAHLARIAQPVLCFNGTRDALCRKELMDAAVGHLPNWSMHWLEGADHAFHVTRASGATDAQVRCEIREASKRWLDQTLAGATRRA